MPWIWTANVFENLGDLRFKNLRFLTASFFRCKKPSYLLPRTADEFNTRIFQKSQLLQGRSENVKYGSGPYWRPHMLIWHTFFVSMTLKLACKFRHSNIITFYFMAYRVCCAIGVISQCSSGSDFYFLMLIFHNNNVWLIYNLYIMQTAILKLIQ
jgi:hypothetical protein